MVKYSLLIVSQIVMWLAQFLSKDDLPMSRIAVSDHQWSYQPGIAIQVPFSSVACVSCVHQYSVPVCQNHGYRKKTGSILPIFITLWVCHQILI